MVGETSENRCVRFEKERLHRAAHSRSAKDTIEARRRPQVAAELSRAFGNIEKRIVSLVFSLGLPAARYCLTHHCAKSKRVAFREAFQEGTNADAVKN